MVRLLPEAGGDPDVVLATLAQPIYARLCQFLSLRRQAPGRLAADWDQAWEVSCRFRDPGSGWRMVTHGGIDELSVLLPLAIHDSLQVDPDVRTLIIDHGRGIATTARHWPSRSIAFNLIHHGGSVGKRCDTNHGLIP